MEYIYLKKTAESLGINPKSAKNYLKHEGYLNDNGQPTEKGKSVGIIWVDEEECRKKIWFVHGRQTNFTVSPHAKYLKSFLEPYLVENKEAIRAFAKESYMVLDKGIEVPEYKNPNDIHFHSDFVVLSALPVRNPDEKGVYDLAEITLMDSKGNEIYHSLFKPIFPVGIAVFNKSGLVDSMLENQKTIVEEFDNLKQLFNTYKSRKIVCADEGTLDIIRSALTVNNISISDDIFVNLDTYFVIPHALNQYLVKYKTLKRVCEAINIKYEEPTRTSYDCHALLHCLSKLKKETN